MDLIGLLIFFIILAVSMPTLVYMQHKSLMELRTSTTASEFNVISKAANSYIEANYTSILSNGGNAIITINNLEQAGYLPATISNTDPYNSTWKIQVEEPKPGYLQGVITASGGLTLNQEELGSIIAQTHGNGGEILPRNTNINNENDSGTVAYGAYGGWTLNLSGYNNPGRGHLVGLLNYYNGEQINNDYLYRDSIAGHPELNTMQTNIDMGNNSINNVNTIQTGLPIAGANECLRDLDGHCVGEIMAASTSETALPKGWQGGLVTRDLYSQNGTVAIGPGQNNANGTSVVEALINDRADNAAGTGGVFDATSPSGNFSSSLLTDDTNGYVQVIGANSTTKMSIDSSTASIQVANTDGADTYIYANNDGNPQDTGLTTDGNIELGHDQNGACSSNSRIYLAGSEIYDGCDGNLHLNPGGGSGDGVDVDGYIQPDAIATYGASCQSNGALAESSDGQYTLMVCKNNAWSDVSVSNPECTPTGCYINMPGGMVIEWGSQMVYRNGGGYWQLPEEVSSCSSFLATPGNIGTSWMSAQFDAQGWCGSTPGLGWNVYDTNDSYTLELVSWDGGGPYVVGWQMIGWR